MLHPHKFSVIMNMQSFNKYYTCSCCNLKTYRCIHVPEYIRVLTYTYFLTTIQILEVLVF